MITFQMPIELLPNVILLAEEAGRMLAAEFCGQADHVALATTLKSTMRLRRSCGIAC